MKLSELKKIGEDIKFYLIDTDTMFVFKKNLTRIEISKLTTKKIWIYDLDFCNDSIYKFLEACVIFAGTPLSEREDILDDEEHKYLSAVIRPFKNKVSHIKKSIDDKNNEYICIFFKSAEYPTFLPNFKANTMYKNMVLDEKYTLEELGL